jgi:hypothetical protein
LRLDLLNGLNKISPASPEDGNRFSFRNVVFHVVLRMPVIPKKKTIYIIVYSSRLWNLVCRKERLRFLCAPDLTYAYRTAVGNGRTALQEDTLTSSDVNSRDSHVSALRAATAVRPGPCPAKCISLEDVTRHVRNSCGLVARQP